jgi:hypothetical protein
MLFDKEGQMSDDEQHVRSEQEEQQDEVEAHRKLATANEEAGTEGDDDVEAHATRSSSKKL